jgi:hypothetical protein
MAKTNGRSARKLNYRVRDLDAMLAQTDRGIRLRPLRLGKRPRRKPHRVVAAALSERYAEPKARVPQTRAIEIAVSGRMLHSRFDRRSIRTPAGPIGLFDLGLSQRSGLALDHSD